MAFDADQKKIVLFGGDDLTKCYSDTWVYDCATRIWSQSKTLTSPPARAGHAMVYIPDQKIILMAGGYSASWLPLKDVWAYHTEKSEWIKLGLDLPELSGHASADYDQKRGIVVMASYPSTRGNKKAQIYALKFDFANAPQSASPCPHRRSLNLSLYVKKARCKTTFRTTAW
jgi:N-acetylneuraminic acid mutarotase